MKEKLLPIQNQLLDRLNRTKEPVSSQFLANSLGVSSKTIRKNLNQLNGYLAGQGARIASKTGSGYRLIVEDPETFERFMQKNTMRSSQLILNPVQVDRAHLIIRHAALPTGLYPDRRTGRSAFHESDQREADS